MKRRRPRRRDFIRMEGKKRGNKYDILILILLKGDGCRGGEGK